MTDDKDLLKYYRSESNFEFQLLSQRMSWYVTCQSFLLTTFAITRNRAVEAGDWFASKLLPIAAITITVAVIPALLAAIYTIGLWDSKRQDLLAANPALARFALRRWRGTHWVSMWFPQITPLCLVVWIVILVETWK